MCRCAPEMKLKFTCINFHMFKRPDQSTFFSSCVTQYSTLILENLVKSASCPLQCSLYVFMTDLGLQFESITDSVFHWHVQRDWKQLRMQNKSFMCNKMRLDSPSLRILLGESALMASRGRTIPLLKESKWRVAEPPCSRDPVWWLDVKKWRNCTD